MRLHALRPSVEQLEERTLPAFIASQLPIAALPPLTLTTLQVQTLLQRAAATSVPLMAFICWRRERCGHRAQGAATALGSPIRLPTSLPSATSETLCSAPSGSGACSTVSPTKEPVGLRCSKAKRWESEDRFCRFRRAYREYVRRNRRNMDRSPTVAAESS